MNLTEHAEADAQLVAIARDGRGARLLVPVGEVSARLGKRTVCWARRRAQAHISSPYWRADQA